MYARVVELVDTLALGASASGREGSSPFSRTKENIRLHVGYFLWYLQLFTIHISSLPLLIPW